ncbi:MAG TPA: tetratricopeptide repeat protein [Vicinamibacterales bacterium]|nr:tetratricopeptide repeat protein [Vicinamibacterales bacterium]HOQ59960.1 tetratricopeptide repeat protein [Vicinamibacterales bacterium]HPK71420.1 tetratricopeptide repeat protein [Vicinamibacterales bacterium]
MKRTLALALALTALAAGLIVAGLAMQRDIRYRELVAAGNSALESDRPFEAIEAFSGAIALKERSMIAHLRRGEAYRRRGESEAALRDLRAAARIDPSAVRPAELLGDLSCDLGRLPQAVDAYRKCAAIDDADPRVQYKLGLALFRAGDAAGAVEPLRRAAALAPRVSESHYLLGLCLKHTRDTDGAIAAFEQAIAGSPALLAAREELAGVYAEKGRLDDAAAQLEAIAALEPDRPERQAALALALARAGRQDQAVGLLGQAAQRFPDHAVVFSALGRVWFEAAARTRDRVGLRKAIEALEPVTRGAAASGDDLARYGQALVLSEDLVRGEAALRAAADRLPVSPDTLIWLANAAERLRHYAIVRMALERWAAISPESDPNLPAVYERVGDLAHRLGDTAAAVSAWRIAAGPSGSPALLARLAGAELAIGDIDAARKTIGRGLALDPRHPALLGLRARAQ